MGRVVSTVVGLGGVLLAGAACCVCASTSVRTPAGERRLGALRVGDVVWSVDVITGLRIAAEVVATRTARRECVRLVHPRGELVCTPDHPIYAPETGQYEPASRWVEGTRRSLLLAAQEGTLVVAVEAVEAFAGLREVVDITVAAAPHNFVAGDVVVHNKSFITQASGWVTGPEFGLTVDAPIRRFEVRTCIVGEEPAAGEGASSLGISVSSRGEPAPASGEMRYAVYFEETGEDATAVIDRPADATAELYLDTLAGRCATPVAIVFERLDDLPDGTIEFTWELGAATDPPPGRSIDDEVDIDVEE